MKIPELQGIEPARIELLGVDVSYGSQKALENISLQIPHGARVAVVGPNGAGKSTLFKALVGLLPLSSGTIKIHGAPFRQHIDCIAYIPQREEVDWRFPVTVQDVVMMGRFGKLGLLQQPKKLDKEIVREALVQMDIIKLANQPIHDLSGGQQQRAFLARALAQQPHILLMDEPFTGVDISTQETTLRLLDDLRTKNVTILVSTHDLNLARERFDQVILLNHNLVAYGSPEEVFKTEFISSAFHTQMLMLDGALVVDQCCGGDVHEESNS
jgi:manganese/iron transport system ATP-binding protein